MVRLLLSHGADIHVRDREGCLPVLVLASHYLRAAVKILLDHGAAADDRVNINDVGGTYLGNCSGKDKDRDKDRDEVADFPVFRHLAWAYSDKLDEEDEEGAMCAHDEELADMLRTYFVPLVTASRDRLRNFNLNFNTEREPEHTEIVVEYHRYLLLHELAICRLIESAKVLLQAGAKINPIAKRGLGKPRRTPLDALLNFMDWQARKASRRVSKAGYYFLSLFSEFLVIVASVL